MRLPKGPFDVVLLDPPWSYHGQQDKWGAAAKFYSTMTDEDLLQFPISSLIHDRSVVFMWATCPRLDLAFRLGGEWGLSYRGVAFVWVKTKKSGEPIGAQGVRPSIVKPLTEMVLAFSRKEKGRPLPLADEGVQQTIFAPKQEHSRKPEAVQDAVDRMYPTATKLELFARRKRKGWKVWGDEI